MNSLTPEAAALLLELKREAKPTDGFNPAHYGELCIHNLARTITVTRATSGAKVHLAMLTKRGFNLAHALSEMGGAA